MLYVAAGLIKASKRTRREGEEGGGWTLSRALVAESVGVQMMVMS